MLTSKYSRHSRFLDNLNPTIVFKAYFDFIHERYNIYLKRDRGEPPPWTDHWILQKFKFTNVFPACDRTNQYLIREVIYKPGFPTEPEEYVFRSLLFKLFNSIPAWEVLLNNFGTPTWQEFNQEAYAKALGDAWNKGKGVKIWNAAYMQNQNYRTDLNWKHERYLALVEEMMEGGVTERLLEARTYEQAFQVLQSFPLHGDYFLPMQHLTSLNYSPILSFSEDDFITPGPGCARGIRKCFGLPSVSVPEAQAIIYYLVDEQEGFFDLYDLPPVTLFGQRRLHAIDIQNCFCETDKFARAAFPEFNLGSEKGKKPRIKQKFRVTGQLPAPCFPPKWNLKLGRSPERFENPLHIPVNTARSESIG